jgi:hypothetical protein
LTGLAIGVLFMPSRSSWRRKAATLAAYALLANAPDLPLPHWGHHEYAVSHSMFVNLSLIAAGAIALGAWGRLRRALGGARMAAICAAAWLSHLLLDSFYNHGGGIAVYWPFSQAHIKLPLPWFRTVRPNWQFDADTLRIVAVEAAFYGSLLAVCILIRLAMGLWRRQGNLVGTIAAPGGTVPNPQRQGASAR